MSPTKSRLDKFFAEGLGVSASAWQSSPGQTKPPATKEVAEDSAEAKRAKELAALASKFAAIGERAAELDKVGRSKSLHAKASPPKPTERPAPEKLDPAAAHNAAAKAPTPKPSPKKTEEPNVALENLYASAAAYEHELGTLVAENARLTEENEHLRDVIEQMIWERRSRDLQERRYYDELAREEEMLRRMEEEEARRRMREQQARYGPRRSEPMPAHSDPFGMGSVDPYADTPSFDSLGRMPPVDDGFDRLKQRHGYTPRGRDAASALFADSPERGRAPPHSAQPSYVRGPIDPSAPGGWPEW